MLGDVRRRSLSEKGCSSGAKGKGKKPRYRLDDSEEEKEEVERKEKTNVKEGWRVEIKM